MDEHFFHRHSSTTSILQPLNGVGGASPEKVIKRANWRIERWLKGKEKNGNVSNEVLVENEQEEAKGNRAT